jgi:hypothetical protein
VPLLFAWSLLGHNDADDARVLSIDAKGFDLQMDIKSTFKSKGKSSATAAKADGEPSSSNTSTVTGRYDFHTDMSTLQQAEAEFESLQSRSRIVVWPPGPAAYIGVIMVFTSFICSLEIKPEITSIYLQEIRELSMTVYLNSTVARWVFSLTILAHSFEAAYVAYLLRRMKFSMLQITTWVLVDLVCGIGLTRRVMHLDVVSRRNKKQE